MMIHYRPLDYDRDVPEVVELLRDCLGESHNEDFFLWKHCRNPFGRSLGFVACDKERIVGVRMLMLWEFSGMGKKVRALRPVDTVTHPDYRRRGVFTNLNSKAVENYKERYDLIINTPNSNSRPINLKLGWKTFPKDLFFKVSPVFSLHQSRDLKVMAVEEVDLRDVYFKPDYVSTKISNEFLHWRYCDDAYRAASFNSSGGKLYIIYRVERKKGIKLIVVTEIYGDPKYHKLLIESLASKLKIFFIYYLANESVEIRPIFSIKRRKSEVVFRDDSLGLLNSIIFSSGDLEGRI